MKTDKKWIRAHLPPDCADEPIDVFSGYYLDGLTVMSEGERGDLDYSSILISRNHPHLKIAKEACVCITKIIILAVRKRT